MTERDGVWATLSAKSPVLFLLAGALLVVYATLNGMETFLDVGYPLGSDVIVGPTGFFLGFIALLGVYPSVADRSPKLATIGAIFAALGAVGWFVTGVKRLGEHTGGGPPGWLEPFGMLIPVGFALGFLTFSIASLRSDVVSRAVAIALLIPLLGVVLNIGLRAVGFPILVGRVIVNGWFAVAYLVIGATLRSEVGPVDRTGPAAETTV